jgi:hypothetical protein
VRGEQRLGEHAVEREDPGDRDDDGLVYGVSDVLGTTGRGHAPVAADDGDDRAGILRLPLSEPGGAGMQRYRLVLLIGLASAVLGGAATASASAKVVLDLTQPSGQVLVGQNFRFRTVSPEIFTSLGSVKCNGSAYLEGGVLSNVEATDRLELRASHGQIGAEEPCASNLPLGKEAYVALNPAQSTLGELTITAKGKDTITFKGAARMGIFFPETEETCFYPLKTMKGTVDYINENYELFLLFKESKLKLEKSNGSAANCPSKANFGFPEAVIASSATAQSWQGHTLG